MYGRKSGKLVTALTLSLILGTYGQVKAATGFLKAEDLTTNNKIYFGTFYQNSKKNDNTKGTSHYLRQGVSYSVVHKDNDANRLVLYSDKALFASDYKSSTFLNSKLSDKLNVIDDSFLKTSFSSREQEAIAQSTIKTERYPTIAPSGSGHNVYEKLLVYAWQIWGKRNFTGVDSETLAWIKKDWPPTTTLSTQKIYIPSYQEIQDYNLNKNALQTPITDFALTMGYFKPGKNNTVKWYLRDKGIEGPEFVTEDGYAFIGGNIFSHDVVLSEFFDMLISKISPTLLSEMVPGVGMLITLYLKTKDNFATLGIKPAFQLDTANVLYVTDAYSQNSGKNIASAGGGFVAPSYVKDNSIVKLTLKDYYDVGSNPNGQQEIKGVTVTNTKELGMTYELNSGYQGWKQDNQVIGILLEDADFSNWRYYAQGAKLSNGNNIASGTASITDCDMGKGTYGLSIYSEQANGYDRTDYAGKAKNIFNIDVKAGKIDKLILVATDEPLNVSSKDAVVNFSDNSTYKATLTAKDNGTYVVDKNQLINMECLLDLDGGVLNNAGTTSITKVNNGNLIRNSGILNIGVLDNYGFIEEAGTLNLCDATAAGEYAARANNQGTIEQKNVAVGNEGVLTNSGSITVTDKIDILAGATVENTGLLSGTNGINNAGTLTSSLDTTHLTGTITNTGTFNLIGDISADVKGTGKTVLQAAAAQVTDDRKIEGTLIVENKTIDMQNDKFSTLTLGNIATGSGIGNLQIDVDMTRTGTSESYKAQNNDAIKIVGESANNSGTLNLASVNFTGNLTQGNYNNYIQYVAGNNDNLIYQLNGGASDLKVVSGGNTVTFSLGTSNGYLNAAVGGIDTGVTLQQFIRGTKQSDALTYVINADQTISAETYAPSDVGTTNRANVSELNLNVNNGVTVTADSGYGGITVDKGYALNVTGSSVGTNTATMTNFVNPLITKAGGTVNISDMKFTGNSAGNGTGILTNAGIMELDNVTINGNTLTGNAKDVINTGHLIFANKMSSLATGISDGGAGTQGTVEFWNVAAKPNFSIEQKNVQIDSNASLNATGDQLILSGEILNNGAFVFKAGSTGNPYVLNNEITSMADDLGTTTFTAGSNIVANKNITQKNIVNEGTLSTNADNFRAANGMVTNNGTLTLTGGTMDERAKGTGKLIVDGTVTVTGDVNQTEVKVNGGKKLTNNAIISANINNDGHLLNSEKGEINAATVSNNSTGTMENDGIVQAITVNNNGTITGNGILEISSTGVNSGNLEQSSMGISSAATVTNTGIITTTLANSGNLVNQGTANICDIDNSGTISGDGTLNLYSTGTNIGTIEQNIINVAKDAEFVNMETVKANIINIREGGTASGLAIDKVLNVEGLILDTKINSGGVMYYGPTAEADNITLQGTMQLKDLTGSGSTNYGMGDLVAAGGTINLAENSVNSYSTPGRTLDMDQVSGNVTFGINADLANNIADNITIYSADNLTANIKVLYDPYYTTYNPADEKTIPYGRARVLNLYAGTITVNGLATDWGPYRITPLIVNNGDGTFDLTNSKTLHASESTMTATDARAVLNQAWLMDTGSLTQRLGNLRLEGTKDDGIWAQYKKNNTHAGGARLAKLNAKMFQAGYDKEIKGKDGKIYIGIAVDHIDGSGNYDNGSGDVKATSVALYNTWIGNSGHYYDFILKQGHYDNDYQWTDLAGVHSKADYSVNATTISGEYGYRRKLQNGTYIEPQVQMIYGLVGDADYKTSHGWPVHADRFRHFITRLGVAAGQTGTKGDYYARIGYYHDFGGDGGICFDNYFDGRNTARNWYELTLGGNLLLKNNLRIYGEISKYYGDVKNSLNYELGLRYSF